jgi:hypothetical protein
MNCQLSQRYNRKEWQDGTEQLSHTRPHIVAAPVGRIGSSVSCSMWSAQTYADFQTKGRSFHAVSSA